LNLAFTGTGQDLSMLGAGAMSVGSQVVVLSSDLL